MKRNILIALMMICILFVASMLIDSKLAMVILSGITALLALLGASTVCLISAPVCIPAVAVGLVTFLAGLGLSFKSIAITIIGLIALIGYIGYKAFSVYKAKKGKKL